MIAAEPPIPDAVQGGRDKSALEYVQGHVKRIYSTAEPSVFLSIDAENGSILYYRIRLDGSGAKVMFETAMLAIDREAPIGIYYSATQTNTAEVRHLILEVRSGEMERPKTPKAAPNVGVISTEKLQIVDSNGNVRGQWLGSPDGSALTFYDTQGKEVILLFAIGNSSAGFWRTADGTHVAGLFARTNENPPNLAVIGVADNESSAQLKVGGKLEDVQWQRIIEEMSKNTTSDSRPTSPQ